MKAIVQDRYGGPDRLRLQEVDRPVAIGDQVLVRVRAASVNARDWHVMRGDPKVARLMDPSTFGFGGPKKTIPGSDFAVRWRPSASGWCGSAQVTRCSARRPGRLRSTSPLRKGSWRRNRPD